MKSENYYKNVRFLRDHRHFTGGYRGWEHQTCNLFLRLFIVLVVFYNLRRYMISIT